MLYKIVIFIFKYLQPNFNGCIIINNNLVDSQMNQRPLTGMDKSICVISDFYNNQNMLLSNVAQNS